MMCFFIYVKFVLKTFDLCFICVSYVFLRFLHVIIQQDNCPNNRFFLWLNITWMHIFFNILLFMFFLKVWFLKIAAPELAAIININPKYLIFIRNIHNIHDMIVLRVYWIYYKSIMINALFVHIFKTVFCCCCV